MRTLWLVLIVLVAPFANAAPPSDARLSALSTMPRWQALLHVNQGATLRGIGSSYVDDADFFLAADGKNDALAELRASWRALHKSGSPARCRFPARYRFLAEHLGWHDSRPLAHCEAYRKWRDDMPIGRLVLVFPAAYLNSPSSMFGHTLLRLDASARPESVWLSRAINFGAQTNGRDNSLFYIWRGLVGGYPGQFSVVSYVKKIREYAFLENRDMWEYGLNLDTDELDWIVRHLWELRGINFDYYFFDENCSFRLLELVKVGRPDAPLTPELRFAELPVNTVRALYAADLVAERRYRPSKAKQLEHLAGRLDDAELDLAQALLRDPEAAESAAFTSRAPARRHLIAKVAYQALRLRHRDGPRDTTVAGKGMALLRIVQRNPAPAPEATPAPPAPETGHRTQMARIGTGFQDGRSFVSLGYRLTYHDIVDPGRGFLSGAGIEGFDLRLRLTETEGLSLESLDLVNIRSLAPRGQFVKPVSWFVHAGLEQAPARDKRRLGAFIQGGPGLSWQYGKVLPYTLAVARAESVSGAEPSAAVGGGAEFGVVYASDPVQLAAQTRMIYFAQDFHRFRTSLTFNMPVSTNNAVRTECSHETWREQGANACTLSFRHFFD